MPATCPLLSFDGQQVSLTQHYPDFVFGVAGLHPSLLKSEQTLPYVLVRIQTFLFRLLSPPSPLRRTLSLGTPDGQAKAIVTLGSERQSRDKTLGRAGATEGSVVCRSCQKVLEARPRCAASELVFRTHLWLCLSGYRAVAPFRSFSPTPSVPVAMLPSSF